MSMPRSLVALVALAAGCGIAAAQGPKLGKPITEAEIAGWDLNIMPDGTGLPPGSGTAAQGARVYAEKCAMCHGENGKGGPNVAVAGGDPLTGGTRDVVKTIKNFFPYSTIVFDFTRRAMPWQAPKTLSNDEVYAVTAYILRLNDLIGENDVIDATTLPKVAMPNRDGFISSYPAKR
jgi:S-disulfanyl-L-cysteine oxidoreductase SoxD